MYVGFNCIESSRNNLKVLITADAEVINSVWIHGSPVAIHDVSRLSSNEGVEFVLVIVLGWIVFDISMHI